MITSILKTGRYVSSNKPAMTFADPKQIKFENEDDKPTENLTPSLLNFSCSAYSLSPKTGRPYSQQPVKISPRNYTKTQSTHFPTSH